MAELIVALDVQTRDEAVAKVKEIGEPVGFYKIGLELFTAEGPDVVKAVKDLGKKVFLDLKFHDIPRTVERAVRSGGKLGVDLMTIHSVGGKAMIRFLDFFNGFLKVDDVDSVSFGEDIRSHFRVPAAGLVTKVYTSFKQLFHRYYGH